MVRLVLDHWVIRLVSCAKTCVAILAMQPPVWERLGYSLLLRLEGSEGGEEGTNRGDCNTDLSQTSASLHTDRGRGQRGRRTWKSPVQPSTG